MFAEGDNNSFYTVEEIEGNNIIIDGGDVYHSDCFVLVEKLNANHSDIDIDQLVAKGYVPDPAKQLDTILKDGYSKERRLNIAAMAMQGLLSNPNIIKSRGDLKIISEDWLADRTLEFADALIAECEKGDNDE